MILHHGPLKAHVTFLCLVENNLFAGVGDTIYVFSYEGEFKVSKRVLPNIQIQGIIINVNNEIVAFGNNSYVFVEYNDSAKTLKENKPKNSDDWILSMVWINNGQDIIFLLNNNSVVALNKISYQGSKDLIEDFSIKCIEKCALFSGILINNSWSTMLAITGTSDGIIRIWKPSLEDPSPVLCTVKAHDGPIFCIAFSSEFNMVVTTSDDRSIRMWNLHNEFRLRFKKAFLGHESRIHTCCVNKNKIISGGEDGSIHVLNMNGTLIKKCNIQQSSSIWTIFCDDHRIFTGGKDCGIYTLPLTLDIFREEIKCEAYEKPRCLTITQSNNMFVVFFDGCLKYYNFMNKDFETIDYKFEFKNSCILKASPSKQFVAASGYKGLVHIYNENSLTLAITKICSVDIISSSNLMNLIWLTNNHLMTSLLDDKIDIWKIDLESRIRMFTPNNLFSSNLSNQIASTATYCFEKFCAIGDTSGNVYVYDINTQSLKDVLRKAHSYRGVTKLVFYQECLFSMGRDGFIYKYILKEKIEKISIIKMTYDWLYDIDVMNDYKIAAGFHGCKFVLCDLKSKKNITSIKCGGGHRNLDFSIQKSALQFCYIQNAKIIYCIQNLKYLLRPEIFTGFHSNVVNCVKFLPLKGNIFLSGGEDTTIKICTINSQQPIILENQTIHSHLSSVRCLKIHFYDINQYLLFSGGGRGEVIVHKLQLVLSKTTEIVNVEAIKEDSYNRIMGNDDMDNRIMDLIVLEIDNQLILIAACSNGELVFFHVRNKPVELLVKYTLPTNKFISKLMLIDESFIISAHTDGEIKVWGINYIFDDYEEILSPIFNVHIHNSTINSLNYYCIKRNHYIIVSGGDDTNLVMSYLKFISNSNQYSNNMLYKLMKKSFTQAANIVGVFVNENYIITVSTNEILSIYKYYLSSSDIEVIELKQFVCTIKDIQGASFTECDSSLKFIVYGQGIQTYSIHFNELQSID